MQEKNEVKCVWTPGAGNKVPELVWGSCDQGSMTVECRWGQVSTNCCWENIDESHPLRTWHLQGKELQIGLVTL